MHAVGNAGRIMAMRRVMTAVAAAIIATVCVPAAAAEERWPQFRGPGALGVSEQSGLPETWSATENVAWVRDIEGFGWGSPIVWGDTVFLTTVVSTGDVEAPLGGLYLGGERGVPSDEHRWMVYAIDVSTGATRWEREVHRGIPPTSHHLKNTYASETAGYRRRARLRVLRQRGALLPDPRWPAAVVPAVRPGGDPGGMGHSGVAGAARRSDLHRQRQRRAVLPGCAEQRRPERSCGA